MEFKDFLKNVITDTKIKLSEEFDRNFERKAFFNRKWAQTTLVNSRGSLMMRTGKLRRSLIAKTTANGIVWTSALPYAAIQNNGGEIIVTEKMKRFFWAMYTKSAGAISKNKKGGISNNQRNQRFSREAEQWKALALKKVGTKITIPQRQFIGEHPNVNVFIQQIVDANFQELKKSLLQKIKSQK